MKTVSSLRISDATLGSKDKNNGLPYYELKLKEILTDASGDEVYNPQSKVVCVFSERKLDNGEVIKANPIFEAISTGELGIGKKIGASLENFKVKPYTPQGFKFPLTEMDIIVFHGENGFMKAAKELRDYRSGPLDPITDEYFVLPAKEKREDKKAPESSNVEDLTPVVEEDAPF